MLVNLECNGFMRMLLEKVIEDWMSWVWVKVFIWWKWNFNNCFMCVVSWDYVIMEFNWFIILIVIFYYMWCCGIDKYIN